MMNTFFLSVILCFFTLIFNHSCTKDGEVLLTKSISKETISNQENDNYTSDSEEDKSVDVNYPSYSIDGNNECLTSGGKANETGLKTWCWGEIVVPSGASTGRDIFSEGQLALSVECSANQVVQEEDRLNFVVNPVSPSPASWCKNNFNMRSEIRTMPWEVNNPSGTEEWFGWDYSWDDYSIDTTSDYVIYQVHEGTIGVNPLVSIQVQSSKFGEPDGTLWFINSSQRTLSGREPHTYNNLGIIPKQGQKIKFVLHIVWGGPGVGQYQLWADDVLVADAVEPTVRASNPVGGNSKFGIYYSNWRNQSNVNSSAAAGVNSIETSMGPLRIITRKTSDTNYGADSYADVRPN